MKSNKSFSVLFNLSSKDGSVLFYTPRNVQHGQKFHGVEDFLTSLECRLHLWAWVCSYCMLRNGEGCSRAWNLCITTLIETKLQNEKKNHWHSDASVSLNLSLSIFYSLDNIFNSSRKFSSGQVLAEIMKAQSSCFKATCISLISLCGEFLPLMHRQYFIWSQWKLWLP